MNFKIFFPLVITTIATVVEGQVTTLTCPPVDTPTEFIATDVEIGNSATLCTLNLLIDNGETLIPVARSYDSNNW